MRDTAGFAALRSEIRMMHATAACLAKWKGRIPHTNDCVSNTVCARRPPECKPTDLNTHSCWQVCNPTNETHSPVIFLFFFNLIFLLFSPTRALTQSLTLHFLGPVDCDSFYKWIPLKPNRWLVAISFEVLCAIYIYCKTFLSLFSHSFVLSHSPSSPLLYFHFLTSNTLCLLPSLSLLPQHSLWGKKRAKTFLFYWVFCKMCNQ